MGDLVSTPEGALFHAEQDLYDGSDSTRAFIATVHVVGGDSVCNTWERVHNVSHKVLEERVLSLEPRPQMLVGEVLRLIQEHGEKLKDLRYKLGVAGLQSAAIAKCDPKKNFTNTPDV